MYDSNLRHGLWEQPRWLSLSGKALRSELPATLDALGRPAKFLSRSRSLSRVAMPSFSWQSHTTLTVQPASLESLHVGSVACHVPFDLGPPIGGIGYGPPEAFALVPMPKAAMNHYGDAILWQNKVRFAGQVFPVEPVPETGGVKSLPRGNLWRSALRVNAGHDPASGGLGDLVGSCARVCHLQLLHSPILLQRF